jgi:uncharacterized membrane protein
MAVGKDFTITLSPHRSMSRQGFIAIMLVVCAANAIVGLTFFAVGAWPVVGFMGLDVALVWWAFARNIRDGLRAEQITARADELKVSRYDRDGTRQDVVFNRRWVRVDLEFDRERELTGKLLLWSKGSATEIASFLGAEEREALANELRRAI